MKGNLKKMSKASKKKSKKSKKKKRKRGMKTVIHHAQQQQVKVEGSRCQIQVLFAISYSWEEFHKQILTDVFCNKYSSFSLSYLCKGADLLLTKHTWKIFIHFIQTQCSDKTVFINVTGSPSLENKLSYKFPSSSSSSDNASSNPASTSKELSKEENVIQQLDVENWSEKFISRLSRTDRESSVIRKLIVNLLKPDTECDKCSHKHKQGLVDHSKEIDSSLEKKWDHFSLKQKWEIFW